ncbi:MAG: hypothetical protein QM784_09495 [Polyangiaceae bacterium]
MTPDSFRVGQDLLRQLGAPARLLRHVELVLEAADEVLDKLACLGVSVRADFVHTGVALHDAGKILHPAELEASGNLHEPDGETLLLRAGVSPELARVCLSRARWDAMEVTLEELLVALSDKLWKGVRVERLEERVIDAVARELALERWDIFIELDSAFECIAAAGVDRLARSIS